MSDELEYRGLGLELRALDEGELEGYAATFRPIESLRETIQRGAFKKTIQERVKRGDVKLLWGHQALEMNNIIGTITEAKEDKTGLFIRAKLARTTSGQEARQLVLDKHINKFSIGFKVIKDNISDDNWRTIKEIKLMEVSLVPFPADTQADVLNARADGPTSLTKEDKIKLASELEDINIWLNYKTKVL